MIRIGFGEIGIFDRARSRSVWRVDGRVVFKGTASLGHGTKLSVSRGATVTFGDEFVVTAESAIAARRRIAFGDGVLVSWDVQIMDSDWHAIRDLDGARLNPDEDVVVGDHVWIGSRALLLKGTRVPSGCVVAAATVLNRAFTQERSLLAGVPGREVRQGISWNPA